MLVSRGMQNSNTNGTIGTDILDTPSHRTGRSRLSFLQRKPNSISEQQILSPLTNGTGNSANGNRKSNGNVPGSQHSSERSRSKENRKSFFGGSIGRGSGRGRTSNSEISAMEGEGGEWVTQSDFSVSGLGTGSRSRGTSSSERPKTRDGKAKKGGRGERGDDGGREEDGLSREGSVGSRVGNVRKRLSRLTLGKKSSKGNGLVMSVAEEE